jgi:anthranilate phosphoribosyltransferase
MPPPVSCLSLALRRLAAGASLSAEECRDATGEILDGKAHAAAAGAFLTALHLKGETVDELHGAVAAIRARMERFDTETYSGKCLDTCGTGGDGADTVNISTAVAIVLAACGLPVVKHGNRAASGRSGSSDVLGRLGVAIDVESRVLGRCLTELGITFLFAPRFHPGLKAAAPVRRELPFRTLFNLVGPLCNPAAPAYQLVGVPREDHAALIAEVLARSDEIRRAVVVTGGDGLDEVSLDGPTVVRVVQSGAIRRELWSASDFGLPEVKAAELRASGPDESARRIQEAFAGHPGSVRSIILANAAAALWAVEPCPLLQAVARAAEVLDSGAATSLVRRWAELTGGGA